MPLRDAFFHDPLLRITPPYFLNDPFDTEPSNVAIERRISCLTNSGDYANEFNEDLINALKVNLLRCFNYLGIISVTEDPYNLLMWSHYAFEHSGIVVEIDCENSPFDFKNEISRVSLNSGAPEKVRYSNLRPGKVFDEEAINDIFDKKFIKSIALTKSNDWIYEKEYRFILDIEQADVLIADILDRSWVDNFFKNENVEIIGEKIKINLAHLENPTVSIFIEALSRNASALDNFLYFKRIKSTNIKSIYFGSRVKDEIIKKCIEKLRNNKYFQSHINFYKSRESNKRFEIYFEEINYEH